jgi:hypothetical protein
MLNFGDWKWHIPITSSAPETFKCDKQPTKTIMDNHQMVQQKPESSLFGQNSIIIVNFLVYTTCIFCWTNSIIFMVYCCFHLILASLNPPSFVCYTHVRIYYQNFFGWWRKPPFVVMFDAS